MQNKNDQFIASARACIGTPFRHQGRLPGIGLDCAGLVIHAAQTIGIELVDYKGYPARPFDGMLKKMLDSQPNMQEIAVEDILPGDILLMRVNVAPQHLAILSHNKNIIHSYQNIGSVCEYALDSQYQSTIVSAYRLSYV